MRAADGGDEERGGREEARPIRDDVKGCVFFFF